MRLRKNPKFNDQHAGKIQDSTINTQGKSKIQHPTLKEDPKFNQPTGKFQAGVLSSRSLMHYFYAKHGGPLELEVCLGV